MNKHARRQHGGYRFDRLGRIIDGFIDNGRLILMIALCLSVSFMVSELSNLSPPTSGTGERETPVLVDENTPDSGTRIQERSDYRVEMYAKCADKSWEKQNRQRCRRLLDQADETIENDLENEIRNKTWSRDEGTNHNPKPQPIMVAAKAT